MDTFHDYDKEFLFDDFEKQLYDAIKHKISLNPILNAFKKLFINTISPRFIQAFMKSMRQDLYKSTYKSVEEYEQYIYGSADVVGLMCLKVFVKGDEKMYDDLKHDAKKLGSAFQKVNFLRDLKADYEDLNRTYFPNVDLRELDEAHKNENHQ